MLNRSSELDGLSNGRGQQVGGDYGLKREWTSVLRETLCGYYVKRGEAAGV
jgi:hypothetical protein